ncbi:MAG: FtsB family cell division protein [Anaerolineae bacterium]
MLYLEYGEIAWLWGFMVAAMEANMSKGEGKLLPKRAARLIWIVVAALAILIGSAFLRAWGTNRTLRAELNTLKPMITAARAEQQTLEARLDYVQSDEYVESWSRTKARMAKPGETLVILISVTSTPVPEPEPAATPIPTPSPTEVPFWARWWQVLIGSDSAD